MNIPSSNLAQTLLQLVELCEQNKTICPSQVARHLAGNDGKQWRLLMKPIRELAIRLAKEGKISIYRKGKVVDPENFKGVYRLGYFHRKPDIDIRHLNDVK